jgi:hypothetical protein
MLFNFIFFIFFKFRIMSKRTVIGARRHSKIEFAYFFVTQQSRGEHFQLKLVIEAAPPVFISHHLFAIEQ